MMPWVFCVPSGLPAPSTTLTLPSWPSLSLLCSGISFRQPSLALQPQRKSWEEGSRVGRQGARAGVREEKDQGDHNFSPVVHSPAMLPQSLHPKFLLQYRPLACLLPSMSSSNSPNTPYILLYPLYNPPILSFLPYLPFQGEKGRHSHCSSLQGAVSSFSALHPS